MGRARQISKGWDCDDLPIAVLEIDSDLRALAANRAWAELAGETSSPTDGSTWLTLFQTDERPRVSAYVRTALRTGRPAVLEVRGDTIGQWLELRVTPARQAQGDTGLLVAALDITIHKHREALLAFDALHDSLTGLHNRMALLERTAQALARLDRQPSVLAVLFVDLDRFKEVNDSYGHSVGDRLLTTVGRRLVATVRPADTVARIGGDEFVVLCESLAEKDEAFGVAKRLVVALLEPLQITPTAVVSLGATVGIALAHDPTDDAAAIIDKADRAMYRAKEQGWEVAVADTLFGRGDGPPLISLVDATTINGHHRVRLDSTPDREPSRGNRSIGESANHPSRG